MRIAMIGTGYVGLVSGACLADFGHQVTCIDKDANKISRLLKGDLPIYEPGLDSLVARNLKAGRLNFGVEIQEAVAQADAVFIAVGTPSRRGDGHADLSHVYAAAREMAQNLDGFTSSSPNRRCRSALRMRSSVSFARPLPTWTWPSLTDVFRDNVFQPRSALF